MNQVNLAEWRKWLAERPESVQAVAKKLVPWLYYRVKSTGQTAKIYSYEENDDQTVTLKIMVNEPFPVIVFGINPDDLEVVPSSLN